MCRAEALQGVRMIKFRSVFERYGSSEPDQTGAAALLGVSERTFRRWAATLSSMGRAASAGMTRTIPYSRGFGRGSMKRSKSSACIVVGNASTLLTNPHALHQLRPHDLPPEGPPIRVAQYPRNEPATSGQLECYLKRTN